MLFLDALRVCRRWYGCFLGSFQCPTFFDKFGYQISDPKKSDFSKISDIALFTIVSGSNIRIFHDFKILKMLLRGLSPKLLLS